MKKFCSTTPFVEKEGFRFPIFGDFIWCPKVGTDDQLHPLRFRSETDRKTWWRRLSESCEKFKSRLFNAVVGLTVGDAFGLDTVQDKPPVAASHLSEAKIATAANEPNKINLGDRLIMQLYLHYLLLPAAHRPKMKDIFLKYGLGDLDSGIVFLVAFFRDLREMNYSVDPIFDRYKPRSNLISDSIGFTEDLDEDYIYGEQKYPEEDFFWVTEALIKFLVDGETTIERS